MPYTPPMTKRAAIQLLGGNAATAARAIGCSKQAVAQWPNTLTPRIRDRVIAARVRLDQAMRLEEKRQWAYAQEAGADPRTRPKR